MGTLSKGLSDRGNFLKDFVSKQEGCYLYIKDEMARGDNRGHSWVEMYENYLTELFVASPEYKVQYEDIKRKEAEKAKAEKQAEAERAARAEKNRKVEEIEEKNNDMASYEAKMSESK